MTASDAVERLTGLSPVGAASLGGAAFRVELADGGHVVAKRSAGAGSVEAEAAGLRWLAEFGDVSLPEVLAADSEWLITAYVAPGSPTVEAAEAFGRGLAALHQRGAPAFGSPPPGGPENAWMGPAPMRNRAHSSWAEFYVEERIRPYLVAARKQGSFTAHPSPDHHPSRSRSAALPDLAAEIERLADRLPDLGVPEEPPARLHGDAWSGNVLWAADGRVHLIDPAAHGGHREGDLAMLALFGTPMLERIIGAYIEVAPLADGWRERVGLHQLFPLLMHAAAFGGGYAEQALAAAREAGRRSGYR